jgi:hypothetical protein
MKKIINEIMGVPKGLDPWIESMTKMIVEDLNKRLQNGWDHEGSLEYPSPETGELVEGSAYKIDTVEFDGKDFMDFIMNDNGYSDMKEFMSSEMFKFLPLWRPTLTYNAMGIPAELYTLEDNTINAHVGGSLDQKFSPIGKINVLPKVVIHFDVILESEGITDKMINELEETISHELLHLYQKIKQMEGGKPGHYGKETALNALSQNKYFEELNLSWWNEFLNLVYLHLSFEINARVTQLYHNLKNKDINTNEDFVRELEKTSMWRQMKMLENFDANEYIQNFELPKTSSFEMVKNPLKSLHDLMNNMRLKQMGVETDSSEKALKSLINLWDIILEKGVEAMSSMGADIKMSNVPQKAKEDPYVFFKFFEDRFHKKAEKWRRKMYKVGSLILQEKSVGSLQKEK